MSNTSVLTFSAGESKIFATWTSSPYTDVEYAYFVLMNTVTRKITRIPVPLEVLYLGEYIIESLDNGALYYGELSFFDINDVETTSNSASAIPLLDPLACDISFSTIQSIAPTEINVLVNYAANPAPLKNIVFYLSTAQGVFSEQSFELSNNLLQPTFTLKYLTEGVDYLVMAVCFSVYDSIDGHLNSSNKASNTLEFTAGENLGRPDILTVASLETCQTTLTVAVPITVPSQLTIVFSITSVANPATVQTFNFPVNMDVSSEPAIGKYILTGITNDSAWLISCCVIDTYGAVSRLSTQKSFYTCTIPIMRSVIVTPHDSNITSEWWIGRGSMFPTSYLKYDVAVIQQIDNSTTVTDYSIPRATTDAADLVKRHHLAEGLVNTFPVFETVVGTYGITDICNISNIQYICDAFDLPYSGSMSFFKTFSTNTVTSNTETPNVRPEQPIKVVANGGPNLIVLLWQEPNLGTAPVLNTTLLYSTSPIEGADIAAGITSGAITRVNVLAQTSYVITDLSNFVQYYIAIRDENEINPSDYLFFTATPTSVLLPAVVALDSIYLLNDSAIHMTWKYPNLLTEPLSLNDFNISVFNGDTRVDVTPILASTGSVYDASNSLFSASFGVSSSSLINYTFDVTPRGAYSYLSVPLPVTGPVSSTVASVFGPIQVTNVNFQNVSGGTARLTYDVALNNNAEASLVDIIYSAKGEYPETDNYHNGQTTVLNDHLSVINGEFTNPVGDFIGGNGFDTTYKIVGNLTSVTTELGFVIPTDSDGVLITPFYAIIVFSNNGQTSIITDLANLNQNQ